MIEKTSKEEVIQLLEKKVNFLKRKRMREQRKKTKRESVLNYRNISTEKTILK